MHSLAQEIKAFSKTALKKQNTRVTTLTGKRIIETWRDSRVQEVLEDAGPAGEAVCCGYVQDLSLDLQVGQVTPWLFLASQDVAQDFESLKKIKVSHILNVAYGVENAFPDHFTYRTLAILDLPDTDITSYFQECFDFISEARSQNGVVLVHCNAGVSRAPSIVIGYLMSVDGLTFEDAFSRVKMARPAICPNPGFLEQLKQYKPTLKKEDHVSS
ncbi:dual specificity protein phosphatase 19a [Polypterus senegalus]